MAVTFLIPAGPMNLAPLFPGVDFTKVDEYFLQVVDQNSGSDTEGTVITTPRYKRACCCSDDTIRLFYVNYLGQVDAINLKKLQEDTEVSSKSWKKALQYPLAKYDGGAQRYATRSNELITGENTCFGETDQEYLKELLAAPNAWIQWTGTQNQDDDYIPVIIEDGKFITRKPDERYNYTLQIQFRFSNENQTVRN